MPGVMGGNGVAYARACEAVRWKPRTSIAAASRSVLGIPALFPGVSDVCRRCGVSARLHRARLARHGPLLDALCTRDGEQTLRGWERQNAHRNACSPHQRMCAAAPGSCCMGVCMPHRPQQPSQFQDNSQTCLWGGRSERAPKPQCAKHAFGGAELPQSRRISITLRRPMPSQRTCPSPARRGPVCTCPPRPSRRAQTRSTSKHARCVFSGVASSRVARLAHPGCVCASAVPASRGGRRGGRWWARGKRVERMTLWRRSACPIWRDLRSMCSLAVSRPFVEHAFRQEVVCESENGDRGVCGPLWLV